MRLLYSVSVYRVKNMPIKPRLLQQIAQQKILIAGIVLILLVLFVVIIGLMQRSSPDVFSSLSSRLENCQQAAKRLAQQQLNLSESPKLVWEFEREEKEENVHIQILLSFQIDSDEPMFLEDSSGKRLLPRDEALNIVCRYPYKPIRFAEDESDYEQIPQDIIFNNQMVALPQQPIVDD